MSVHVFIDNSNIFHGARRTAYKVEPTAHWLAVRVYYKHLFALLEGDRQIATRVLAGSVPPGNDELLAARRLLDAGENAPGIAEEARGGPGRGRAVDGLAQEVQQPALSGPVGGACALEALGGLGRKRARGRLGEFPLALGVAPVQLAERLFYWRASWS